MEGERSLHFHKILFWTQVTFKTNKAGVGILFLKGLGIEYFRFVGPKVSVNYSPSPSS